MKKEILTRETIKTEYLSQYIKPIVRTSIIILSVLLPFLIGCIAFAVVMIQSKGEFIYDLPVIFIIGVGLCIVVIPAYIRAIFNLCIAIQEHSIFKNNKFDIVTDVLTNKRELRRLSPRLSMALRSEYVFCFAKYGNFRLPYCKTNVNLHTIEMCYCDAFDDAVIGDTYYLIGYGTKILCVYNARYVEFNNASTDFVNRKRNT